MARKSKRRLILVLVFVLLLGSCMAVLVNAVRQAQSSAERLYAYGRLCQMRLALQNYEQANGTLPPLCVRDKEEKPIQSWRVFVLPYVNCGEVFNKLDISQPWNSDANRKVIEKIPPREWVWFARGSRMPEHVPPLTHIFALVGDYSLWNAATDLPRGEIANNCEAILLVSVPESQIQPLQPGDITEAEVRSRIEQGQEVLFIMAGGRHDYGIVEIKNGKLAFPTWEEALERAERGE